MGDIPCKTCIVQASCQARSHIQFGMCKVFECIYIRDYMLKDDGTINKTNMKHVGNLFGFSTKLYKTNHVSLRADNGETVIYVDKEYEYGRH